MNAGGGFLAGSVLTTALHGIDPTAVRDAARGPRPRARVKSRHRRAGSQWTRRSPRALSEAASSDAMCGPDGSYGRVAEALLGPRCAPAVPRARSARQPSSSRARESGGRRQRLFDTYRRNRPPSARASGADLEHDTQIGLSESARHVRLDPDGPADLPGGRSSDRRRTEFRVAWSFQTSADCVMPRMFPPRAGSIVHRMTRTKYTNT